MPGTDCDPIKNWLALFVAFGLLAVASGAMGDMQAGKDALAKHDFEGAFKAFMIDANDGNADAQALIANLFRRGLGVRKSYAQAVRWYARAAEQGHASAQYNLGVHYQRGLGVAKDPARAVRWYTAAAHQNESHAQINLALSLMRGDLGAPDPVAAYAWALKAQRLGNRHANKALRAIEDRLSPAQLAEARALADRL